MRRNLTWSLLAVLVLAGCVADGGDEKPDTGGMVWPGQDARPGIGDAIVPEADASAPDLGTDGGEVPDPDGGGGSDDAGGGPGDATPGPDAGGDPDAAEVDAAPDAEPDAAVPSDPCRNEGARRACPPAIRATCPEGIQTCTDGFWSRCTGPAEVCDGIDQDCDGEADNGFGLGGPCPTAPGACAREGVLVCSDDGGTRCMGQVGGPSPERCDGIDNDCDGTVDDGFGLGQPCEDGVGACHQAGTMVCDAAGTPHCSVQALEPVAETCDGTDDDCDGSTDEDFELGRACDVGVGACARNGRIACAANGEAACDAVPGRPAAAEACDGADDDCDGTTDEGFDLGRPCQAGDGECRNEGVIICVEGAAACSVRAGAPEVCDGVDNDCNDQIDEGFDVGAPCRLGAGACSAEGVLVCDPLGRAVCNAEVPLALNLGDGSDGDLVVAADVELDPSQPYQFTSVTIRNGGVLRVAQIEDGARLDIRVRGAFIVENGGLVDLSGAGYAGGAANPKVDRNYDGIWTNGGGTTGFHGRGPGGGGGGWSAPQGTVGAGGGGGHAAAGANGVPCGPDGRDYTVWDSNDDVPRPIAAPPPRFSAGGVANGAADLPDFEPGSGGGSGGNNYDGGPNGIGGAGGHGGGAMRVVADSIDIRGVVRSAGLDGQPGVGGSYVGGGGGGAGGSVHLIGFAIGVAGSIAAPGGAGAVGMGNSNGGAGSAGRIRIDAIVYEAAGRLDPPAHLGELPCER